MYKFVSPPLKQFPQASQQSGIEQASKEFLLES